MIKPYFQGTLDVFCAIYAVLNALRLTHGLRSLKAREIMNDALLSISEDKEYFRRFLNQDMDYIDVVDSMLQKLMGKMHIDVSKPFTQSYLDKDLFWKYCNDWFGPYHQRTPSRAILFRFLRYVDPKAKPLNLHWTVADYIKDNVLHLFDCSHEAEAVLNIRRESFVTDIAKVDKEHLLYIQPETIRFIRLPF